MSYNFNEIEFKKEKDSICAYLKSNNFKLPRGTEVHIVLDFDLSNFLKENQELNIKHSNVWSKREILGVAIAKSSKNYPWGTILKHYSIRYNDSTKKYAVNIVVEV